MPLLTSWYRFSIYVGIVVLLTAISVTAVNADSKPLKIAGSVWPPFIVDQGAEKALLEVRASNEAAIILYKKFGFTHKCHAIRK